MQRADALLHRAEPRNCRLPLAAEPLFQTTSSALAVWSPYTSAGFGHRRRLKKEKHHSLPSLCLIHSPSVRVDFPCALPHTFKPIQMKNVKARPPGWAMPGQRKISPVCINEAQCPAHVSLPLHRHAWGWLGAAPPALLTRGNLHQVNQFPRCERSETDSKPGLGCEHFPQDSAVRKDLVRDLSEGQQGSLDFTEWAGTQPHLFLRHFKRKGTHILQGMSKLSAY